MRFLVQLAIIAAFNTAAVQAQEDWARFHIGVAVGDPYWSVQLSEFAVPAPFLRGDGSLQSGSGRKLVAGFRPLRFVGVELQYSDFGEADASLIGSTFVGGGQGRVPEQITNVTASAHANVLTALLFMPEALPWLDVYGKVGVADFDESLTVNAQDRRIETQCRPPTYPLCTFSSNVDQGDFSPYAGVGVRFKVAREAALRVEYEAIDASVGSNTTMVSLGIAWER